jgi:hypothetical protein
MMSESLRSLKSAQLILSAARKPRGLARDDGVSKTCEAGVKGRYFTTQISPALDLTSI